MKADASLKPLLDALRPIVEERILDEGRAPDEAFTTGWMSRYSGEVPLWDPNAASEFRQFCRKAQADYPAAKAFDDEKERRFPHKNQCLAVILAETQAGRWNEIDPEERDWAVDQELMDFSSNVAPSGACLSRWRPGMTYDPSAQSVVERAPERYMLDRIASTRNTDLRARAIALMNRGGSDAGLWSIYPSKTAILAMTLDEALATVAGVGDADWRAMAMSWLYETKDPQRMITLADQVLNSGPLFDAAAGADLFARAAARGSPYAIYRLGRLYLTGLGVPKSEGLGEQYLAVAAGAGIPEAEQLLLSRDRARDEASRAALQAQYWAKREAMAHRRFQFSLQCGYSPPDDDHDWICVE